MSGAPCFTADGAPVQTMFAQFDHPEGSCSPEDIPEDFPSVTRTRAVPALDAACERLAAVRA
jgi:uncharacterized protein (DUF433 family)